MKIQPQGYKFKVKAKDWQVFNDITLSDLANRMAKKGDSPDFVIESPNQGAYADFFQKEKLSNWALKNLNNKGFNLKHPVIRDDEDVLDVYVIKDQKLATKIYDRFNPLSKRKKNEGNPDKTCLRFKVDSFLGELKAIPQRREHAKMVTGSVNNDIHHSVARDLLVEDQVNKHFGKLFKNYLKKKKANIKEIEYKPTPLMRAKAKAVEMMEKLQASNKG